MSDWSEGTNLEQWFSDLMSEAGAYDDSSGPLASIYESLGIPREYAELGITPQDIATANDIAASGSVTGAQNTAAPAPAPAPAAKNPLSELFKSIGLPGGQAGAVGLGALLGLIGSKKTGLVGASQKPAGYQGGIPKYTASRAMLPTADVRSRVPGSSAQRYFSDTSFTPLAVGGMARGRYLAGSTDGMADELPANIDGKQPAALSHGEFVVPADVVSHLGNGNSEAGAKRLYAMMERVRKARTGNPKQGKMINADKYLPK